jgi:hypothetical protein
MRYYNLPAGSGVAIASHATRRRRSAASHSFVASRCCSRFAEFAASSTRTDACVTSRNASVSTAE